jgi:putative component of toxin-antitoxin plasmid stabilization module
VYEAKSGSIRIYLFHEEKTGRVIVTGGKKGEQDEDIAQIEHIIKSYYNEK